jgi:hypothetical protein
MRFPRWTSVIFGAVVIATPVLAGETVSYTYDGRGRLVQVSRSGTVNNGVNACYTYDRGDNRKNVTTAIGSDCATFSVSATNVAAPEGSPLLFTVNKVGGSSSSLTVNYATFNGTATAGTDYTATTGTLTFAAGDASKTVSVATTDDGALESNETLLFTLSSPSGVATLVDAQATGAILNNDGITFAIDDVAAVENGTAMFTVTKSGTTASSSTISYATADNTATSTTDYFATSGTLTFAPSETTKSIIVAIRDDTIHEATETFKVNLSNAPLGASFSDAQGVATIYDTD